VKRVGEKLGLLIGPSFAGAKLGPSGRLGSGYSFGGNDTVIAA
jgi:hypothetical protein